MSRSISSGSSNSSIYNVEKNVDLEQKINDSKTELEENRREFEIHKETCKTLYDKYLKLTEIRAPINVKVSIRLKLIIYMSLKTLLNRNP